MVYIFKKLNDLAGAPTTNDTGNVIAGQAAGATQGTHESTFRNPSAVYNANVGQDMGGLETGVNKNIAQTQESLNKSSADYQSQLQGIDSGYKYGGRQDLENIGDTATFSRLSSLVNPAGEQSQLAGVKSNSANYQPDTSGLAQSSTMGGLSSQLQNQYGTSAGGSRLDALLYRGGGQAGKAINQGLNQINQFSQGQQQQLGQESNLLSQLQKGAVDKSNQLKSEGATYKDQLKAGAATQAQQAQTTYDAARTKDLEQGKNTVANTDYRKQLQEALDVVFGPTPTNNRAPKWSQKPGSNSGKLQIPTDLVSTDQTPVSRRLMKEIQGTNAAGQFSPQDIQKRLQEMGVDEQSAALMAHQATMSTRTRERTGKNGSSGTVWAGGADIDMTDYLKNQMLESFSKNINMGQFDPSKYQGEARTFNQDSYLDPRFNQLGQLLGTEQIAGTTAPSTQYQSTMSNLNSDIQKYLNEQTTSARDAANRLFDPNTAQGAPNDRNIMGESLKGVINNPLYQNAILGIMSQGGTLLPGGQRLSQAFNQGFGGVYGSIEDGTQQLTDWLF